MEGNPSRYRATYNAQGQPPYPPPQYQPPPPQYYPPPQQSYQYPPPYYPPPYPPQPVYGEKSEILALILSFIWAGLGQIYNGQISKGIVHMVGIIVIWIVAGLFFWLCVPIFIPLIFAIYSMVDAYKGAKQYNESLRMYGRPPW